MSLDTINRTSVYPPAVEELVPRVRQLAAQLGEIPSRNRVMREFNVGSPKATAVIDALRNGELVTGTGTLTSPDPVPTPEVVTEPDPVPAAPAANMPVNASPLPVVDGHPGANITATVRPERRAVRSWPVALLALPAFVAIWSGWVGLGTMTGFGVVHPLPGIWDAFSLNTAITLPIGVEAYAAFALKAWLSGSRTPRPARRFAKWSAIGSLVFGAAGQVAYHLMESAGITAAPWQITTAVSCLPVVVLGMGAALAHLLNTHDDTDGATA